MLNYQRVPNRNIHKRWYSSTSWKGVLNGPILIKCSGYLAGKILRAFAWWVATAIGRWHPKWWVLILSKYCSGSSECRHFWQTPYFFEKCSAPKGIQFWENLGAIANVIPVIPSNSSYAPYISSTPSRWTTKQPKNTQGTSKIWLNYIWLVDVGGIPTPLKNIMKVSWDDDIPNIWKNKIHVPNHPPDI